MAAAGRLLVALAGALITAIALSPHCIAASSSLSLDCATVTSLLAGCKAFVRHGAAAAASPGAACCQGVAELYAVAADSADNWRSVCGCMAGLVRWHSSNASAIALLPVLCGALPPRTVDDTLTYCTSPA